MSAVSFYVQVVQALEQIEASYMIVGAFAGLAFGINRVTFDIDILVDLRDQDIEALADHFPLPRYYADPEQMRDSIRLGIMFNIIDIEEGVKADLVPLTRKPDYRTTLARRVRKVFADEAGNSFTAWCAQPTDIIIGKLQAWTEGRSDKHLADIHHMLMFSFGNLSDEEIDLSAITAAAARLGPETLNTWQELLSRAQNEET